MRSKRDEYRVRNFFGELTTLSWMVAIVTLTRWTQVTQWSPKLLTTQEDQ